MADESILGSEELGSSIVLDLKEGSNEGFVQSKETFISIISLV